VSVALLILILALHAACAVLVVLYCPALFESDTYQGGHCETHADLSELGCDGCEVGGCLSKSDGELVSLNNIIMSFKLPRNQDLTVWNWKLTASLTLYFKVFGNDLLRDKENNSSSFLANLDSFEQVVSLSGSIDYALNKNLEDTSLNKNLEDPIPNKNLEDTTNSVPSLASAWHSKARIRHANRTLRCRLVRPPDGLDSLDEVDFVCVLTPLVSLFPLSNSTYITSLQIDQLTQPSVVNLVSMDATILSYLSIVTETRTFHTLRFYLKCTFVPLLLCSLVWFIVRLCMNDLYISIPDRLLITAAIAQMLNNFPTELLVTWLPFPQLLLLNPVARILSHATLALFWIIFTLDKLADNEPWERTTRFYWRSISLVVVGCTLALLSTFFLNLPPLSNPFLNHWDPHSTTWVSLGLILSLAVGVAVFQSYLSIIIFRVICDISIHYPTTSRAWRLKGVLVYALAVSILVSLGWVLEQVITLCLHWNPDPNNDPLPFGISGAGSSLLVELAAVNLHVVFLLLALSRSHGSEPGEGWYAPVRPALYSPVRRDEPLHLWDLSAHPSPLHKFG